MSVSNQLAAWGVCELAEDDKPADPFLPAWRELIGVDLAASEGKMTRRAQHRWFCAEEESGVIPKLIVLFVFGNKLAARRTWHVCM
jgi:hypothetical protein